MAGSGPPPSGNICMEGRERLPALLDNAGEPALSGPSCSQTVAWPGFFGNVAETPISREVFLGEAGLMQGKAVSKCPTKQKSY